MMLSMLQRTGTADEGYGRLQTTFVVYLACLMHVILLIVDYLAFFNSFLKTAAMVDMG